MQDAFARFAFERLGSHAFIPQEGQQEELVFAASLASTGDYFRQWRGRTEGGEAFKVSAGFLDRMQPNALADRWQGMHYVAINQALLVTMVEFALFAFTQRDVFPAIGDVSVETSPLPANGQVPGVMLLDRTIAHKAIDAARDRHRVPVDADRHVAAVYTAILMARFVWMHELAHCYHGHVALAQARGYVLGLHEVQEPLSAAQFAFGVMDMSGTLIDMEFEADEAAMIACCNIQLAGAENLDGIKVLDLPIRLRMTLFAAYAMTWLFEEYRAYYKQVHGWTHPKPFERLRNVFNVAANELEQQVKDFDALQQDVIQAFAALRRSIPALHRMDGLAMMGDDLRSQASRATLSAALKPYRFHGVNP